MLPLPGWVIDVDPGDYVPAPPGTTVGLLYAQHATRNQLYAGGVRASLDPRLDSDVGILRLVHYTAVGGINDAPSRIYLGITPYLILPTGSYDRNRPLNLGENRWKFNLQVGFSEGLTERWHVDPTADAMFHGKNDDFGAGGQSMRQDRLYQAQAYSAWARATSWNRPRSCRCPWDAT